METVRMWVFAVSALLASGAATAFVAKLYLDPGLCVVAPQPTNAKKR